MASQDNFTTVHYKKRNRKSKHSKRQQTQTHQHDPFDTMGSWGQVDISGWTAPPKPTSNDWDTQIKTDRVSLMVPYWWQGVLDANEGGVPGRMADFFLKCEEEEEASGWGPTAMETEPWCGVEFPGWGANDDSFVKQPEVNEQDAVSWGAPAWGEEEDVGDKSGSYGKRADIQGDAASDETARSNEHHDAWGMDCDAICPPTQEQDSRDFVEQVARAKHASPERTQRMHKFYAVSIRTTCTSRVC